MSHHHSARCYLLISGLLNVIDHWKMSSTPRIDRFVLCSESVTIHHKVLEKWKPLAQKALRFWGEFHALTLIRQSLSCWLRFSAALSVEFQLNMGLSFSYTIWFSSAPRYHQSIQPFRLYRAQARPEQMYLFSTAQCTTDAVFIHVISLGHVVN